MSSRDKYDRNLAYIIETGSIMSRAGTETPNLQFKVTAFMPADLMVNLHALCFQEEAGIHFVSQFIFFRYLSNNLIIIFADHGFEKFISCFFGNYKTL